MLNTKKLLYILPDLAYLVELLPGKKEHEYDVSSFKQVSGKFLNEKEFLPINIAKLFTKLENSEYHLILPDFLFTNTIVTVDKDSDDDAIKYVEENTLPSLKITKDTHEITITVLTTFKGQAKVQISAIEKTVLSPISQALVKTKNSIKAISPFSWTVKAIVSLEPSITVFQLGTNLYTAEHYIGVDQTNNFPVSELSSIVETIKTLKGAESSIQTVYLSSNSLVEEELKEKLGSILPIQQLASYKEDDSKMPSYIKYAVESAAKTLSIPDFPVPQFSLDKISKKDINKEDTMTELKKPQVPSSTSDDKKKEEDKLEELPKKEDVPTTEKTTDEKEETPMKEEGKTETVEIETVKEVEPKPEDVKKPSTQDNITKKDDELPEIEETKVKTKTEETKKETKPTEEEKIEEEPKELPKKEDINLSQFAGKVEEDRPEEVKTEKKVETKAETKPTEKKVIKNSSGVNNMLKMIFITLAVFFITIAIGIGVGLGLLKMSDKKQVAEVVPEVVVEPTATPKPSQEPEEEINKEEISILIVNATTKAGYAGKIKTLLTNEEFSDINAGNAKGEYKNETDYILMTKENKTLKEMIEKATDLTLEYSEKIDVEDQNEKYDAVIVLAK